MQNLIDSIASLYKQWSPGSDVSVDVLPQSGSERRYFRLHGKEATFIGTYGANVKENDSFIYFSNNFYQKKLAVPAIYQVSEDGLFYIQEDLGNVSLLNQLEKHGFTKEVYSLFKKSLEELVNLQVLGDKDLDYSRCLTNREFGKQAIMADLLYFKYYFWDALRRPYDKQKLIDDFEALSNYLTHTEYKYFMFRDFQSRNILVRPDGEVRFIDYQGGMKGAPQYDVASMLWQARANLPNEWKYDLLDDFMNAFENKLQGPIDRKIFQSQYHGYVLIRLLQVLGAYGFRGLFERKAQFLTSIPLALHNLKDFLTQHSMGISVPEFRRILDICVSEEVVRQFTPTQATDKTPLIVTINSFSYKDRLPADESGNGGGFIFDCRGILNPGRIESMKQLTGKNKEVRDYLEQQTKMPEFINSIFDIVDITVENYIQRDFKSLTISFGCTGGQHRSVYAAEELARHLRNKFKVNIRLSHIEQEKKNRPS